jgi:hypothetical protein
MEMHGASRCHPMSMALRSDKRPSIKLNLKPHRLQHPAVAQNTTEDLPKSDDTIFEQSTESKVKRPAINSIFGQYGV